MFKAGDKVIIVKTYVFSESKYDNMEATYVRIDNAMPSTSSGTGIWHIVLVKVTALDYSIHYREVIVYLLRHNLEGIRRDKLNELLDV